MLRICLTGSDQERFVAANLDLLPASCCDYGLSFWSTQANLEAKLETAKADPTQASLRRFLGIDGGLGSKLGLPDDFVVQVIRATGNYGEIYDRHLGVDSAVTIPRGANRLADDGGLMIAPPFT